MIRHKYNFLNKLRCVSEEAADIIEPELEAQGVELFVYSPVCNVNCIFIWNRTTQGWDYWNNIDSMWNERYGE